MVRIRRYNPPKDKRNINFLKDRTKIKLGNEKMTPLFNKKAFLNKFGKEGLYFLKDKNKIIGVILFAIEKDLLGKYGLIYGIHITKKARRKGYGSMLMERAEELFKKKNIKRLFLDVDKSNKKAIEFYRKMGYKVYSYRMFKEL